MAKSLAPSSPPTFVNVSEVTSSSITVQWGPVDCIHRNGDITGYLVQYGEVEGTEALLRVVNSQVTITGLTPFTQYTVSVAAVNSAGTGVYSDKLVQETAGEYITDVLHDMCVKTSLHCILHRCIISVS